MQDIISKKIKGKYMCNLKKCARCGEEQDLNEFYYSNSLNKYSSRCKGCYKKMHKERYKPVPEVQKSCAVCGGEFIAKNKQKVKCDDCRYKTVGGKKRKSCRVYFFICKGCNEISVAKQKRRQNYCTHECFSTNSKHFKNGIRRLKQCETCGKKYKGTTSQKYCSDKCKVTECTLHIGNCEYCNNPFTSKIKRGTCNSDCSYELQKQRMRVNEREFACTLCGTHFKSFHARRKLCKRCSKNNNSSSFRKRARKHNVYYEPVNRYKVYNRDKYTCQMCGTKTLKSKAGTAHDREPNIDHIIPISKGGPHNYNNVQTLCRKCNIEKSDNLIGQQVIVFNLDRHT